MLLELIMDISSSQQRVITLEHCPNMIPGKERPVEAERLQAHGWLAGLLAIVGPLHWLVAPLSIRSQHWNSWLKKAQALEVWISYREDGGGPWNGTLKNQPHIHSGKLT